MMTSFAIRCRSCTPAPTGELTDWLEAKVAELREHEPRLMIRLATLSLELSDATIDDGWLIEIELPGVEPSPDRPEEDLPDTLAAPLEELLRDMRILGLGPTVLGTTSPAAPLPAVSHSGMSAERSG